MSMTRPMDKFLVPQTTIPIAKSLLEAQKESKESETKEWNPKSAALKHRKYLSDEVYLKLVKARIRNYKIVTWNVNCGLQKDAEKCPQIQQYLADINPHIFMGSEVLGMRFGYHIKSRENYAELKNMTLISHDRYGVTAIYCRTNIKSIIPIFIDSEKMFPGTEPKDRIHASAAIQYLKKPLRGSNLIIFLALYRSPNSPVSVKKLALILDFIIRFCAETSPNIVLGGDLNIRMESICGKVDRSSLSSELREKYKSGDELAKILKKYKINCTNKYGQATFWRENGGEKIIDTIATNMNEAEGMEMDNNYMRDVQYSQESDHYPNLQSMNRVSVALSKPQTRTIWKLKNLKSEQIIGFGEQMKDSVFEINKFVFKYGFLIDSDFKSAQKFVTTTVSVLHEAQNRAAMNWFGQVTQRCDYNTHLDSETREKITEKKVFFKKHRTKIVACLAMKRYWNRMLAYNPGKETETPRQKRQRIWMKLAKHARIVSRNGRQALNYYNKWVAKGKDIGTHVQYARELEEKEETQKTITDYRSKGWYALADRIGKKRGNKTAQIPLLIKARYATKHMPEYLKNNLTAKHFAKDNKANADNIARHMCSLGHPSNHAYDHGINKSRAQSRIFDKPYDFMPKIWAKADPESLNTEQTEMVKKYRTELGKLTEPYTYAEIESTINYMKNNKAYHGNTHILFIKYAKECTIPLLQIIFEWWKDNGVNTNNLNARLMNPLLKDKDKRLLACIRPIEYGAIEFKIYATANTRRIERYAYAFKLLPPNQYSAKMASGSEHCLIDITTDIDDQHSNGIPVTAVADDCSDAYNSMDPDIIDDKMRNYCGFGEKAMTLFASLTHEVTSQCRVNGVFSEKIRPCNSKFSQGFSPSGLIWCLYTAPLVKQINKEFRIQIKLENSSSITINARIMAKVLMDDITKYTKIWIEYNNGIRENDQKSYHKSMKKQKNLSINDFIKLKPNKVYKEIGQEVSALMQRAITRTHSYLNTNNIPTNKSKSYIMAIEDSYYQRLMKFRSEFDEYGRSIFIINHRFRNPGETNVWQCYRYQLFINKIQNLNREKYTMTYIDNMFKYAIREGIWSKNIDKHSKIEFAYIDVGDNLPKYVRKHKRIDENLTDHMHNFRNYEYKIDNETVKYSPKITVLGNIFDKGWTFEPQVRKIKGVMGQIRRKCFSLLYKTRRGIGMGMIKYFIESTAIAQLHYNGCTYMNLANTNPLRMEYNSLITVMNRKIYTLSMLERMNFNGFDTFESFMKRLNAKAWSGLLRLNEYNGLFPKKIKYIKEIKQWKQENRLQSNFEYEDQIRKIPNNRKGNIIWCWYFDALELKTSDTHTYDLGNFALRNPTTYKHYTIPKCVRFSPYTTMWTDLMSILNRIKIVVDGSVTYYGTDRRSHMFGKGGCAVSIWFRGRIIFQKTIPLSTRTQVNITELHILQIVMEWINDPQNYRNYICISDGIDVISDSQNCLTLISNNSTASDDVSIEIYQKIGIQMDILSRSELIANFIVFHWVHSHAEASEMNDYVDLLAKTTTKQFLDVMDSTQTEISKEDKSKFYELTRNTLNPQANIHEKHNHWLNPNSMISLKTVKSEVKHRAKKLDEHTWNKYKKDLAMNKNIIKYSRHYYDLGIQWDPKKHAQVIPFMPTQLENDIRILLITAHLPLNAYLAYKACKSDQIGHCTQHHICAQEHTEEHLVHMLLQCPAERYLEPRQEMIDGIMGVYKEHNESAKKDEEKYEYTQNIDEIKDYVKQIIDPPSALKPHERAQIYTYAINYVKETRFDVVNKYLEGKCKKENDRPMIFDRVEAFRRDNDSGSDSE